MTGRKLSRTSVYRQRQRHGIAVLTVPVPVHQVLEALVVSERLTPGQALERRAVEAAIAEVVAEWAAAWQEGGGRN